MIEKMPDSIISPSDGDTSEEEEYTKIMSTNNSTVAETVDETSNASYHTTCNFFQLLSPMQVLNVSTVHVYVFTLSEFYQI